MAQFEYPPFAFVEDGELIGLEGEVLSEIAARECLKIEVVTGDPSSMITSVQTGRADTTLGSWYRTAARAEVVRLSAPVVTSPLAVLSKDDIDSVEEITRLNAVGTNQALAGVDQWQALLGDHLKLYPTSEGLLADLKAGRIQAAVAGLGAAIGLLEADPIAGVKANVLGADDRIAATVTVGQTNFPTSLQNVKLGEAIDDTIQALRDEGVIAELAEKYGFPASIAEPGEPNLL